MTCTLCNGSGRIPEPGSHGDWMDCECQSQCNKCKDTGRILFSADKCDCRKKEKTMSKITINHISNTEYLTYNQIKHKTHYFLHGDHELDNCVFYAYTVGEHKCSFLVFINDNDHIQHTEVYEPTKYFLDILFEEVNVDIQLTVKKVKHFEY